MCVARPECEAALFFLNGLVWLLNNLEQFELRGVKCPTCHLLVNSDIPHASLHQQQVPLRPDEALPSPQHTAKPNVTKDQGTRTDRLQTAAWLQPIQLRLHFAVPLAHSQHVFILVFAHASTWAHAAAHEENTILRSLLPGCEDEPKQSWFSSAGRRGLAGTPARVHPSASTW
mgnify:CR=1 FL=1